MGDASPWGSAISLRSPTSSPGVRWPVLVIMSAISWYLIIYKNQPVVRPEAQPEVPRLFWSANLARGGAERAQRARCARAVRHLTAHRCTPGASRQVRRRQARGDRQ